MDINCRSCQGVCAWKLFREDIVKYWYDCKKRGKEFGNLGCVDEDGNRRARKICYIKYNQFVDLPPDTPSPPCVVDGISFLFPSDRYQDGTILEDFLEHGERPRKKKKVNVEITVSKSD